MDVYPDARVMGAEAAMSRLIKELRGLRTGAWLHANDLDAEGGMAAFRFTGDGLPTVTLWLTKKSMSEGLVALRVTQVVPAGQQRISPEEYQAAIESFFSTVREITTALSLDAEFHVGGTTRTVDDYLAGSLCRQHLDSFTANANVQVLHPLDRDRWLAFCICCHASRKTVPTEILQEHLESKGFPSSSAESLAESLAEAEQLLSAYDSFLKRGGQLK